MSACIYLLSLASDDHSITADSECGYDYDSK